MVDQLPTRPSAEDVAPPNLEAWRAKRNLTQRELAERSGVALTTINEVETGRRRPRPATVRRLAAALGVGEAELLRPPGHPEAAPSYLADIADFFDPVTPRSVVFTERRWMEPYRDLERGEHGHRLTATREHAHGFELWLRALALYKAAFTGVFDWGGELPDTDVRARNLRADLLGLAGASAKPALDLLAAGYYWLAFGAVRNLLEAWLRAGFVRLRPVEAPRFFQLPDQSPVGPDGRPRPSRERGLRLEQSTIHAAFAHAHPEDRRTADLVGAGIAHFHGGAHPSAEGLMQLVSDREDFRVFGPTYDRRLCAFGLKWGLCSLMVLLKEAHLLRPQEDQWVAAYNDLAGRYGAWLEAYSREFPSAAEEGDG